MIDSNEVYQVEESNEVYQVEELKKPIE